MNLSELRGFFVIKIMKERMPYNEEFRSRTQVIENLQSADDLGELSDAVYNCICSAFGVEFDERDALEHIKGDYVMLPMEGNNVLGFSSLQFDSPKNIFADAALPEISGCYFAAAAIAKEAQGKGIYRKMNNERITLALKRKDPLIFTRTQNPRVETSIKHALEQKKVSNEIAGYALTRVLIENCYGKMLTGELPPKSPDEDIQREHDKLNVQNGDAYLLMYAISY